MQESHGQVELYVILGTIAVKPEHLEEFLEHVKVHAARSRLEPGCLRYDVLQDRDHPNTICLYEVFRAEEDLLLHHQQDYYTQWIEMSRDWRDRIACTRRVLRSVTDLGSEDPVPKS